MTKKTAKLAILWLTLTMTNKDGRTETEIAPLGKTSLKKKSCGPICGTLVVLNKNKITPQAYHRCTFIGNHCHKYFKTGLHKQRTRHLLETTLKHTDKLNIPDQAFASKIKQY